MKGLEEHLNGHDPHEEFIIDKLNLKTNKMQKIVKAILKVMDEVKGIDKSLTVGAGRNSYKGVSDRDVKLIIGSAMLKNGLTILPIGIEKETKLNRWDEEWQGNIKRKQSIFTEVKTKYLLLHDSGESIELCGYGHGVDSQDKSAGKATTYALKYCLLYTFLVPTGKIDDADTESSNIIDVPKTIIKKKIEKGRFENAIDAIRKGKYTTEELKQSFKLSKSQLSQIDTLNIALSDLKALDELKTKLDKK